MPDLDSAARTRELLQTVRRIQIHTAKLIREIFAGQYRSAFKGRGMAFSEVREYMPGDDIRAIDWNVTARSSAPFVKQYVEERELTILLVVDISASGRFGSGKKSKMDLAAEIAAILAFSAIQNNDRVGLVLFSDRVEHYVPPVKGVSHMLRLVRDLLFFEPTGSGTSIRTALDFVNHILRRRSVVFLISDFQAPDTSAALPVTSKRHDLIAVRMTDPLEDQWPDVGLIELEDLESGRAVFLDTSSRRAARALTSAREKVRADLSRVFQSLKIDHLEFHTDRSLIDPLREFFYRRRRRNAR